MEDNVVCILFFVFHFQMVKQKVYLFLEHLDQLGNLNIDLLFCLIRFVSFCVSYWKYYAWFAILVATITEFPDQFISRVISQLIKVIAGVFQKLLRYFNGTIISTISVPLSLVPHVNFTLRLNESVI